MEATVAGIRTEMTVNAGAPGAHTTMIDPSSWRLDFQHLVQNKAGVSPDQMTDATTTATVGETVDTTVGSRAAMATESESGEGQTGVHEKISLSRKS